MTRARKLVLFAAVGAAATVPVGISSAQPPDPGWAGIPHCSVPNVNRLKLAVAKRRLRGALCQVGFVTRRRSSVKKGRVVLQVPEAGTQLGPRTQVDLTVSKGRGRAAR